MTGHHNRNIWGDRDRSLWVDKQRFGRRDGCGTFDILVAARGVARILLPDGDIPGVDLHLYERAGRRARRTGRSVRRAFFEHQRQETASRERKLGNENKVPRRVRVTLGETEVGSVDCVPR